MRPDSTSRPTLHAARDDPQQCLPLNAKSDVCREAPIFKSDVEESHVTKPGQKQTVRKYFKVLRKKKLALVNVDLYRVLLRRSVTARGDIRDREFSINKLKLSVKLKVAWSYTLTRYVIIQSTCSHNRNCITDFRNR